MFRDEASFKKYNRSYFAHIYDFSPGPRYDEVLSPKLETAFSNLMLLCDGCHRKIDRDEPEQYPVSRLIDIKASSEERIRLQTEIRASDRSQVILFGEKIGDHSFGLRFEDGVEAMTPRRYPYSGQAVELGVKGLADDDSKEEFFAIRERNLIAEFVRKVDDGRVGGPQHYSLFAIAPQPLLVRLGVLLGSIQGVDVYERHRDMASWKWPTGADQEEFVSTEYTVNSQLGTSTTVALNLSLSATITNDRIYGVVGQEAAIWTLTHPAPVPGYLKSRRDLTNFRQSIRRLFDQIKATHGQDTILHVFPAMPVSAAVEFGRTWMPKADMRMIIYDQHHQNGGFVRALSINSKLN